MKLSLLIICTVVPSKWRCTLSFSALPTNLPILVSSSTSSIGHISSGGATTKLFSSPKDETSGAAYSEGLRSLLPTPKKRTLQLDKFGRRVHDLTDDGTTQYSKRGDGDVAISSADAIPMQR